LFAKALLNNPSTAVQVPGIVEGFYLMDHVILALIGNPKNVFTVLSIAPKITCPCYEVIGRESPIHNS
jgi:hypothetical protein